MRNRALFNEKSATHSFRQIRYYIATVDAGKLSLAAANLNVSQSAITSAIKSLEGELEAHLFERHSNGVSLTYEGHRSLQHAQNIVAAVSEATRAPRRSGPNVTGEIRAFYEYLGLTFNGSGHGFVNSDR